MRFTIKQSFFYPALEYLVFSLKKTLKNTKTYFMARIHYYFFKLFEGHGLISELLQESQN